MGEYYVSAVIQADNLAEAWYLAGNLPKDLEPFSIPDGVTSFSITEESTHREFSFNSWTEEEIN